MSPAQKHIFRLLLILAAAAFFLTALPNAAASKNLAMVQMFEPDEAAPLPTVLKMIAPAPSLGQALRNFVFYEYYYYGFPYFALSALLVLPLRWLGLQDNLTLVMLVLRQLVSVLPMLAALLLLVYMQERFRSYRSLLLFAFLISVPAVLGNNFWWHPDGITFLMAVLVIFFLQRDQLRFGRNFLLAAVFCGMAAATKLVGVYFFLAVGLTLLTGLVLKKASFRRLALIALAYLGVMALSFLISNPFLLSHWARDAYLATFNQQTDLLSQGYGIVYDKGLEAAWPTMHNYYGEAIFLIAALGAALWGLWRGPQRGLYGLILAWFVPVTLVILWVTHFKYQYWLPAALPLFSCLIVILPEKWTFELSSMRARIPQLGLLLLATIQFGLFVNSDISAYSARLQRADNNPRIQFYDQILAALKPLPAGPLKVYYDYRLYVPARPGWDSATNYDLLNYDYIQQGNFDVLLLLRQRIRDYLNPNATGIDPAAFALSQQFYRDADSGAIRGYHLLYRDEQGLVFVRDLIYTKYYQP